MSKTWEQRLAEAREREEQNKKEIDEDEGVKGSDGPHLVNLNEDPLLDRKVVYEIDEGGSPLTCGRRNKKSEHKLQLSGSGMQPDHCKFIHTDEGTVLTPLSEKAISQIRINGKPMTSMDGVTLVPNDRICIGPSAIFLYKNKKRDELAVVPDTDDDPISFDFANDECIEFDEQAEKEEASK